MFTFTTLEVVLGVAFVGVAYLFFRLHANYTMLRFASRELLRGVDMVAKGRARLVQNKGYTQFLAISPSQPLDIPSFPIPPGENT